MSNFLGTVLKKLFGKTASYMDQRKERARISKFFSFILTYVRGEKNSFTHKLFKKKCLTKKRIAHDSTKLPWAVANRPVIT